MKIELPIKIVSVQNVSGNWHAKQRRRKEEQWPVGMILNTKTKPLLPVIVRLTRIAPRPLDSHDNLRTGFKNVADEIARRFGVADNDSRITWSYEQEKGPPKTYVVRIEIEQRSTVTPPT